VEVTPEYLLIQAPLANERSAFERSIAREMESDKESLVVSVPQVQLTRRGEQQARQRQEERERLQKTLMEEEEHAKAVQTKQAEHEQQVKQEQLAKQEQQVKQEQQAQELAAGQSHTNKTKGRSHGRSASSRGQWQQQQQKQQQQQQQQKQQQQRQQQALVRPRERHFQIEGHNRVGDTGHAANRPGSPKRADFYYTQGLGSRAW
jgi:hypothetical protein